MPCIQAGLSFPLAPVDQLRTKRLSLSFLLLHGGIQPGNARCHIGCLLFQFFQLLLIFRNTIAELLIPHRIRLILADRCLRFVYHGGNILLLLLQKRLRHGQIIGIQQLLDILRCTGTLLLQCTLDLPCLPAGLFCLFLCKIHSRFSQIQRGFIRRSFRQNSARRMFH